MIAALRQVTLPAIGQTTVPPPGSALRRSVKFPMTHEIRFRCVADRVARCGLWVALAAGVVGAAAAGEIPSAVDFERIVAPVFERRCLECHGDDDPHGKLTLTNRGALLAGGESGPAIVPGAPTESLLLDYVRRGADGLAAMPKGREPLHPAEVEALERWIAAGAPWPEGRMLTDRRFDGYRWWSLEPLARPPVPHVGEFPSSQAAPPRNPIDAFIRAKLQELKLAPAPEPEPAVLCRRLYFDLIGLPPAPEELNDFVRACSSSSDRTRSSLPDNGRENGKSGERDAAYEALVDRLLASPHYGERWARHWLDVVHFGETHGYDKDKPRPNAWPYRDYVIRAFNGDKPYARFVEEQLAGDVLHSGTRDGIEALGFISAGPWDLIGHAEVPETKIDGKIARHLDRDDMVATTVQTFNSLTVQCAQCHDHKFDPITQADYYGLQAVFAAVDRADKRYDVDPAVAARRAALQGELDRVDRRRTEIETAVTSRAGEALKKFDAEIAELKKPDPGGSPRADAFGYHSAIAARSDVVKWVQIDLGRNVTLNSIVLHPCRDDFNDIGDGFGFPVRYRVEVGDDAEFKSGTTLVADFSDRDVPNPGVVPQAVDVARRSARYVRITAAKLAPRKNDFIFALAEVAIMDGDRKNAALGATVTSLDSIESGVRWRRSNLVDGYAPGAAIGRPERLAELVRRRAQAFDAAATHAERRESNELHDRRARQAAELAALPPQSIAYVGAVYQGTGAFQGTGAQGGKPRSIFVLARGNVTMPRREVGPGALSCVSSLAARFEVPADRPEGERRAALARWIVDPRNPLTWRSIVNRVWQHHFGRGIVDTPNDFGRNGALPTHPELLDWLAVEFRDGGGSFKRLHKLIVMSATYRQSSFVEPFAASLATRSAAEVDARAIDSDNRYLRRMNRRRLDAESLRDALLAVSGLLDRSMYGPSFRDFVIEKPEHSPHYEYRLHDPADPKSHRRSIYRFIVRSQPQPFLTTFDCADPSMQVDKRNESLSPLQALTLLNNGLTIVAAERFAERLEKLPGSTSDRLSRAFSEATGRPPTDDERSALAAHAEQFGLTATCRVLFNLNEFLFID